MAGEINETFSKFIIFICYFSKFAHIARRVRIVFHWLTSNIFIHSFYFYSTSSSPQLLRGAPDRARILCQSFTPKRHRQLLAKDLLKVPTWRLEQELNPQPFGR